MHHRTALIAAAIVLASLSTSASADPIGLGEVTFDAAALDRVGAPLEGDWAIIVIDNRAGTEAKYVEEVSMTSGEWGETAMGALSTYSPWADVIAPPQSQYQIGDILWTTGTKWYTSGSRDRPTCQPACDWYDVTAPLNPLGLPEVHRLYGYVAPGTYWYCTPHSSEEFFHSPATAEVDGLEYLDHDVMPTFDGLVAIPEPATIAMLAAGLVVAVHGRFRRRSRPVHRP